MNERFKQLYTEASEWALHNYPPPVNPFEWEDLRSEKFAELIVRECMILGFNAVYEVADDSKAFAVYQNIKQHFGVEE